MDDLIWERPEEELTPEQLANLEAMTKQMAADQAKARADAEEARLAEAKRLEAEKRTAAQPIAVITTPVAGTLLRYAVGEGREVQKEAKAIIIESMEMELELRSTASGKIHFLVPEGVPIAAGQELAQIW
jgi:oxaloacetate decarboxylase alpha subunit